MRSLLFAATLMLASCTSGNHEPHDPLWGRDACAHCRMILSEERYAAQIITSKGKAYYYDDLGCALIASKNNSSLADAEMYVRPESSQKWIKADDARYQQGLPTPMNYGFGAVSSGGKLSFDEVKQKFGTGKP